MMADRADSRVDYQTVDASSDTSQDIGQDIGQDISQDMASDQGLADQSADLLPRLNLAAAAQYSKNRGGGAVLVQVGDNLIFEQYQNGATATTTFHLHSATKAFWAAACVAAIDDGLLSDLDVSAHALISEWSDAKTHPGKNKVTLRTLIELTSGLSQDVDQIQGLNPKAPDIYRYVVDSLQLVSSPGKSFQYGPSHYYAFGVMLSRALAKAGQSPDPLTYLERRIFDPIGLKYDDWARDQAGNPHIPNGAYLTPRNWLRFGRFMLLNGQAAGKQVISKSRLLAMRQPGKVNPGHGGFLWLNAPGGYGHVQNPAPKGSAGGFIYHHGHPDMFAAMGAGRNRMYMFPRLDMVVLRNTLGDKGQAAFDDHEFLATLFGTN
jgi:CubicO group peptidase (beta-lactamase class C family)